MIKRKGGLLLIHKSLRGTMYDYVLSETRPKWFKKVRKFDSRCYCWENNGLTVEVVVWGPRIYEIETNYKTLKVIGHWSDFEVKILYRSSSLSKIILYRESNGK